MIYVIWCAGVALTAFSAYRMARNGLIKHLLMVWSYLVVSVVYSAALIATRSQPYRIYTALYTGGLLLVLLAKFAAVTEIYWALAKNCPRYQRAGSAILTALGFLATAAAGVAAVAATPVQTDTVWGWLWHASILLQRYTAVAILVILVAILALVHTWLSSPHIPIPRYARRAAWVLGFDAALGLFSTWFSRTYAFHLPYATAMVWSVGCVLVGSAWVSLKVFEERAVTIPPVEEMDRDSLLRERDWQMIYAETDDAIRTYERNR